MRPNQNKTLCGMIPNGGTQCSGHMLRRVQVQCGMTQLIAYIPHKPKSDVRWIVATLCIRYN